jgi:hypothetical protein
VHAIHDDETFIEGQHPTSVYSLAYYPHNITSSPSLDHGGRSKQALAAARQLKSKVNLEWPARCRCCRR